jgi:hypothetical protein
MSAVSVGFACPSWSAAEGAERPASAIKVATVFTEVVGGHRIEVGVCEGLAHHVEGVGRVAYTTGDRCWEDLTGKLIFNYVLGLTPLQHDHGPGRLADTSSRNKNGIGPPCVRMGAGFVIAAVTCSSG